MNRLFFATTIVVHATLLAGCAGPGSYVVLLPSPDGSVGNVTVNSVAGQQVLTQAQTGVPLDASKPPFEVSSKQLTKDFGATMAARPPLPEQFLLYFLQGGSQLTPESMALLPKILARAKARPNVDLSVIGHTDTQGNASVNDKLAFNRATTLANQLCEMGLLESQVTVQSHGKRNLLVSTPDETAEPRNRRVEVILR